MEMKNLKMKVSTLKGLLTIICGLIILILVPIVWDEYGTFVDIAFSVLTPFIGGFIIAYLFLPLVELISTKLLKGKFRALTSLVVLVVFASILIYLLLFVFPLIATQLYSVFSSVTVFFDWLAANVDSSIMMQINTIVAEKWPSVLASVSGWLLTTATSYVSLAAGYLFNAFMMFVIAAYFLIDQKRIMQGLAYVFPEKKRDTWIAYFETLNMEMRRYLKALGIITSIGFCIVSILLTVTKTPNAIALALVFNLIQLIPMFGSIIGSVVIAIITLPISFNLFLVTGIGLLIYSQVDANFIQPRIFSHSMKSHDLLIILSMFIGGNFFGLVGVLFAIPILVAILHTIKFVKAHKAGKVLQITDMEAEDA
ncbi:MAG: AI-2E family transporter [Culicoidibacterales bacterium]